MSTGTGVDVDAHAQGEPVTVTFDSVVNRGETTSIDGRVARVVPEADISEQTSVIVRGDAGERYRVGWNGRVTAMDRDDEFGIQIGRWADIQRRRSTGGITVVSGP